MSINRTYAGATAHLEERRSFANRKDDPWYDHSFSTGAVTEAAEPVLVTGWFSNGSVTGRINANGALENRNTISRGLELLRVVRDPITGNLAGADVRAGAGDEPQVVTLPAALAPKQYSAPEWQKRTGLGFSSRDAKIASEWLADALTQPHAPVRYEVEQPGWSGDRLHKTDAFSPSSADESAARRSLTAAVDHIVTNRLDKLAALVGASVISPQIERISSLDPFVVHAYGGTTSGKTSGAIFATAVWGDPSVRGLQKPWNNTVGDITATIREHRILPVFLDETGTITDPRPERILSQVVMNVTSGRERGRLHSTGERREAATSALVLISTGEQRLSATHGLTGIPGRVVEIPAPLMPDAETAEKFKGTARRYYGWIGYWLTQQDWMPPALPELKATTPVANRIRPAVAACVAGFAEICRVLDVEGFNAVEVGQALLDEIADNLAEIGESPGERLWEAVKQDFAANPALYPTASDGLSELMMRDRRGIRRDNRLHIFAEHAKRLAADTGVDLRAAMRELQDVGRLISGGGKNLTRQIRVGDGERVRVYTMEWASRPGVVTADERVAEASETEG